MNRCTASHCGWWRITPVYGSGLARPIVYHLWRMTKRSRVLEGSGPTQRDCKLLAQRIHDHENSLLQS